MTTKEEIATAVAQEYSNAVLVRLKKNGNSGWGGKDSLYVIESLVALAASDFPDEGFDPIRDYVDEQINPSAFRSGVLEKTPKDHPFHVEKSESRGSTKPGLALLLKLK